MTGESRTIPASQIGWNMRGFEQQYKDLPDYILKCTHQIWEGRNIAAIGWHYDENIQIRTPIAYSEGNRSGIANTMETLFEFPDRQLYGEDVIWSEHPEYGYLSSHRIVSEATHLMDGVFGKASGKRLRFRTIADTNCIGNSVHEEWLVRDLGAMSRQIGLHPRDMASQMIAAEGGPEKSTHPFTPDADKPGKYRSQGNDNEWGQRAADLLRRIMDTEFSAIVETYDRGCQVEYPGGISAHSTAPAEAFWLGLRSSFPNAEFGIDHVIGREDPMMPPRAAVRWHLTGLHEGWGTFGAPSGAPIHVMANTHFEFGPWGLRREWTIYDEVSIWKQILLAQG